MNFRLHSKSSMWQLSSHGIAFSRMLHVAAEWGVARSELATAPRRQPAAAGTHYMWGYAGVSSLWSWWPVSAQTAK